MLSPGDAELVAGLKVYERGRFADSAQYLQRSIDLGLNERDQVVAHKYLAFIHCAEGREAQCRDEFRLAIKINPAFNLEPAEAGHPSWGPAFRTVKGVR
jgi:tetratricopeptide (TPR) repeat protein